MDKTNPARMSSYLPAMDVAPGVVSGRSPLEGYQRGWGLQFGDLAARVEQEPLYREACAAGDASIIMPAKRQNLYVLLTRFLPRLKERNIVEFGAYRGGSAIFMATVMREIDPTAVVYALDTFAGMPVTDKTIDAHGQGDFSEKGDLTETTALDAFYQRILDLGLTNILPVQGMFDATFPGLAHNRRFGLAHIDADIYASVRYAQDAVWPSMTPGGYVVYDDAEMSSCLGATQAVEELIMERRIHSEQVWPHFVFRAGLTTA